MEKIIQKPVFINHLNLIRNSIQKQKKLKAAQTQAIRQQKQTIVC